MLRNSSLSLLWHLILKSTFLLLLGVIILYVYWPSLTTNNNNNNKRKNPDVYTSCCNGAQLQKYSYALSQESTAGEYPLPDGPYKSLDLSKPGFVALVGVERIVIISSMTPNSVTFAHTCAWTQYCVQT